MYTVKVVRDVFIKWIPRWRNHRLYFLAMHWRPRKQREVFKCLRFSIGFFPGHFCVGILFERPVVGRSDWALNGVLLPGLGIRVRYRRLVTGRAYTQSE